MKGSYCTSLVYLVALVMTLSLTGCAVFESSAGTGRDTKTGARRRRERPKDDGAPKVGDKALLFKLASFEDPSKQVDLAEVIREKPVVFFTGSYT